MVITLAGCRGADSQVADPPADGTASSVGTVTLTIDRGGDDHTTFEIPKVPDGMTLETLMRSVDQVPIQISGGGTTAFVHSIDGIATSADEGWTFTIDGKHANQGIGSTRLHPPTNVTWRFGSFQSLSQ